MKMLISVAAAGMLRASTAQGALVDLTDNTFTDVTYEVFPNLTLGPIVAFDETVGGVTFSFATAEQFRTVGTWGDGTTNAAGPWALQFGGAGGNPDIFTLTVDTDIQLDAFHGFAQQFNTHPIFDVTGVDVSSVGNAFTTEGFLGSATPVADSFVGGPLQLRAGTVYTFTTTNAGAATNGYITALEFTLSDTGQQGDVPVPGIAWLMMAGLAASATSVRSRKP